MLWVRPGVYFLGLDSVDSTPDGLGLRMPSHWTWLAERATFRKENYEIEGSPMKLCFQLIPSIAQQEHAVALLHLERELAYNQEILNNYLFSKLNLSFFFCSFLYSDDRTNFGLGHFMLFGICLRNYLLHNIDKV